MQQHFSVWNRDDFEPHRHDLISELSRQTAPFEGDITGRKRKAATVAELSSQLVAAYGPEILTDRHDYDGGCNYLETLSPNQLMWLASGEQIRLPLEVLMHLEKEQAIDFLVGAGSVTLHNWQKFMFGGNGRSKPLVEIISSFIKYGNPDTTLQLPKDAQVFPRRYEGVSIDERIAFTQVNSYRLRDADLPKEHNNIGALASYLRCGGSTNNDRISSLLRKRDESPRHLHMKNSIARKGGQVFFEPFVRIRNGSIYRPDAIQIDGDQAIVYEVKSSASPDQSFLPTLDNLKDMGLIIFYNFGIYPRLVFKSPFCEESVPVPPVNPSYQGRI